MKNKSNLTCPIIASWFRYRIFFFQCCQSIEIAADELKKYKRISDLTLICGTQAFGNHEQIRWKKQTAETRLPCRVAVVTLWDGVRSSAVWDDLSSHITSPSGRVGGDGSEFKVLHDWGADHWCAWGVSSPFLTQEAEREKEYVNLVFYQ